MTTAYTIRTYTSAAVLTHVLTDFLGLVYSRRVAEVGMCQFTLNGDHSAVADLDPDADPTIEVLRRDSLASTAWRVEFAGKIRQRDQYTDANGLPLCTLSAVDGIGLLALATVAYPAQTAGRNTWTSTPAETVAKQIVTYNLTSAGTLVDGRKTAVTITNISVEADAAGGSTITYSCAWQNVLAALRSVAAIGNGDFDMIRTAPGAWQFRWYSAQRGVDRSASVVFALNYGNMAQPRLVQNHLNEATVAIVGGQGEESSRTVVTVTGPNYRPATNAAEIFVNASHVSSTVELTAIGQARLSDLRAVQDLDFDAIQTPGCRYADDYDLGDLVTARYKNYSAIKQITGVTVELTGDGAERIAIDTSTVATIYHIAMTDSVTVAESGARSIV